MPRTRRHHEAVALFLRGFVTASGSFASLERPRLDRVALVVLLFLSLELGFVSRLGARDVDEASAAAAAPEVIPCGNCDKNGREPCSDCGGRGRLYRACERCKGSGRRPCPSCSKETESATSGNGAAVSVPPGKIRCTLCRGSGRAGSDYRACSKCLGGGVLSCDTCSGSGTVRCIAEVYDRDCPTCRRTGKVECSKCRGTRQIERPEPEASSATVETESASGNNDSKRSEPGVDELEARFIELRALDEACEMWAKGSARSEIERVEDELRVTLQRLDRKKRGEELELLHRELSDIRQRILRLETEWSAIADVLEDFRREFDRCEEYWAKGLEISSSSRSDTSAIARGRWEKDMALVLRLAQGKARRVAGRSPEDYEANVGAIAARVEEIRSQVDEILARPSEESAAEEEEAASLASNDAEREPSDAIDASEGKTDPSGLAKTAEPDAPSSRTGMLLILGVVLATAFGIAFRRTMRKRIERAASHGSFS